LPKLSSGVTLQTLLRACRAINFRMFIIAEPYARFERSLEQPALERGAAQIEDTCRKILREHLADRYEALEITIIVRVESGSTRAWITVGSIVTALTFYGSIEKASTI
jgi:hypothetical protein